jgi:alcohol dehydrogenase
MGNEFSGVVEAIGQGVRQFRTGDEVYVRVHKDRLGAFAEYAVAEEAHVSKKPLNLSFEGAAGVPLVALTSWQALHEELGIRPGYKLFIPAGAGGIGSIRFNSQKSLVRMLRPRHRALGMT